jgi:hypothetical protein
MFPPNGTYPSVSIAHTVVVKKMCTSRNTFSVINNPGIMNEVEGTVGEHLKCGLKFFRKRKGESYCYLLQNSVPTS